MTHFKQKNMIITYAIEFLLSVLLALSSFKVIYDIKYKVFNLNSIFFTTIIICSLFYILKLINNIIKNDKKEIHKIFVSLMIPIGMFYLFFLIPGHAPDEDAHYYRAYEISTGKLISDSNEKKIPYIKIPLDLANTNKQTVTNYNLLIEKMSIETKYDDEIKVDSFTQIYFPILYTIPAMSFTISTFFNLNIIYALYLARICNFILFLILGYYAIKIIPFGKVLLATYLFIPMVIHQGVSISVDSIVNSMIMLFIAYILNLYFKKDPINEKEKIIFYLFATFIAFAKTIYMPIIFISLILLFKTKNKNRSKTKFISNLFNKENQYIWIGIILCTIIAIGWFLFTNEYRDSREIIHNTQSDLEQTISLITSPMKYIEVILNTIIMRSGYLINTFIGGKMGWLNIPTNEKLVVIYLFLLIIAPFTEKHEVELTKKQKILFVAIFCISTILIFTAMYVNRIAPEVKYIESLQGRYFIPIAILLLICLCKKNKSIKIKYLNLLHPLLIISVNIISIYKIICFF